MQRERGFSIIKLMFILAVLGFGSWSAYVIFPVYSTYWQVQDAFEAMSHNMSDQSADTVRARLPEIFRIKYIAKDDLPEEFYDNLEIKADGSRVELSSYYTVTVWLFGEVQDADPEDYSVDELKGLDLLRDKGRLDFEFEPIAATP